MSWGVVGANVGIGGSGKGDCWPGVGLGEGLWGGGGEGRGCNVGLLCLFGCLGCIGGKVGNGVPANGLLLVSTKDTGLENGSGRVAPASGIDSSRSAVCEGEEGGGDEGEA